MGASVLPGGRVIAPAGSGKTRVLTERLRHLVGDRGVDPGTVSALAYNTRAAGELQERCSGILSAAGPHIRTLNSTGLWICSEFGPGGRPRVVEEAAVRELLGEVFTIRRQANADTTAPYLGALSAIRLGLVPPDVAEEEYPDAEGVAEGFDRFRSALAEQGAVEAMRLVVLQDPPRAAIEIVRAVRQVGEERLDPRRAVQPRQRPQFALVEKTLEHDLRSATTKVFAADFTDCTDYRRLTGKATTAAVFAFR